MLVKPRILFFDKLRCLNFDNLFYYGQGKSVNSLSDNESFSKFSMNFNPSMLSIRLSDPSNTFKALSLWLNFNSLTQFSLNSKTYKLKNFYKTTLTVSTLLFEMFKCLIFIAHSICSKESICLLVIPMLIKLILYWVLLVREYFFIKNCKSFSLNSFFCDCFSFISEAQPKTSLSWFLSFWFDCFFSSFFNSKQMTFGCLIFYSWSLLWSLLFYWTLYILFFNFSSKANRAIWDSSSF